MLQLKRPRRIARKPVKILKILLRRMARKRLMLPSRPRKRPMTPPLLPLPRTLLLTPMLLTLPILPMLPRLHNQLPLLPLLPLPSEHLDMSKRLSSLVLYETV